MENTVQMLSHYIIVWTEQGDGRITKEAAEVRAQELIAKYKINKIDYTKFFKICVRELDGVKEQ